MLIEYKDIETAAFKDLNDNSYESLFFSPDVDFFYSRQSNFRKIFEILVLKLGIVQPEILQSINTIWRDIDNEERESERNKLEIIERAIKMGEYLIEENRNILFKSKKAPNFTLSKFFHISQEGKEFFIKQILLPLLRIVWDINTAIWTRMPRKKGLWRELKDFKRFLEMKI